MSIGDWLLPLHLGKFVAQAFTPKMKDDLAIYEEAKYLCCANLSFSVDSFRSTYFHASKFNHNTYHCYLILTLLQ
jgi:hypothetical protein